MIITRTPLRISFVGGGTDFPHWYEEHGEPLAATCLRSLVRAGLREASALSFASAAVSISGLANRVKTSCVDGGAADSTPP